MTTTTTAVTAGSSWASKATGFEATVAHVSQTSGKVHYVWVELADDAGPVTGWLYVGQFVSLFERKS